MDYYNEHCEDEEEDMGCCYEMGYGAMFEECCHDMHDLHMGDPNFLLFESECPVETRVGGETRFAPGACTDLEWFATTSEPRDMCAELEEKYPECDDAYEGDLACEPSEEDMDYYNEHCEDDHAEEPCASNDDCEDYCNFDNVTAGFCELCQDVATTCAADGFDTQQGLDACVSVCESGTEETSTIEPSCEDNPTYENNRGWDCAVVVENLARKDKTCSTDEHLTNCCASCRTLEDGEATTTAEPTTTEYPYDPPNSNHMNNIATYLSKSATENRFNKVGKKAKKIINQENSGDVLDPLVRGVMEDIKGWVDRGFTENRWNKAVDAFASLNWEE